MQEEHLVEDLTTAAQPPLEETVAALCFSVFAAQRNLDLEESKLLELLEWIDWMALMQVEESANALAAVCSLALTFALLAHRTRLVVMGKMMTALLALYQV